MIPSYAGRAWEEAHDEGGHISDTNLLHTLFGMASPFVKRGEFQKFLAGPE